jgi:hypothetical protein
MLELPYIINNLKEQLLRLLVFHAYVNEMHSSRSKIPSKNLVGQRCAKGFNSGVKGLKHWTSFLEVLIRRFGGPVGRKGLLFNLLTFSYFISGVFCHPLF